MNDRMGYVGAVMVFVYEMPVSEHQLLREFMLKLVSGFQGSLDSASHSRCSPMSSGCIETYHVSSSESTSRYNAIPLRFAR